MQPTFDPATGQIVYGQDENGQDVTQLPTVETPDSMPLGADPYIWQSEQYQKQQRQQEIQKTQGLLAEDKPFISGATFGDLGKMIVNLPVGFATDLVDLGTGVVDASRAVAAKNLGVGEFAWDQVFDDSDNPLTRWRRSGVGKMDTGLGEITNQLGRLAFDFVGFKWVYKAPIIPARLQKIKRLGGVLQARRAMSIEDVVNKVPKFNRMKRGAAAAKLDRADKLGRVNARSEAATTAVKIAQKNDYLASTFADIAKIPDAAGFWKNTQRSLNAYAKSKLNIRTLSETFAWDVFLAFNVMGEGDDDMDETLFDFAQDLGFENGLTIDPLETGISRKAKGMLEGVLTAGIGGAFVDLWRIRSFSKQIKNASGAERKRLLNAFASEADGLGRSVAEVATAEERFRGAVNSGAIDPNSSVQQLLGRMEQRTQFGPNMAELTDFNPYTQRMGGIDSFEGARRFAAYGDAGSELQQSLAQMDGLASDVRAPANFNERLRSPSPPDPVDRPFKRLENERQFVDRAERAEAEAYREVQRLSEESFRVNQPQQPVIQDATPTDTVMRRVRAAEPTFSPIGMRAYAKQMINAGFTPAQVEQAVLNALPRQRVDLIEYAKLGTYVNELGVVDAVDGMIGEYIYKRGLKEGWAGVTENGDKYFIRSQAYEADLSGLLDKQARSLDELRAIKSDVSQRARAQELADDAATAEMDAKMKSNRLQPVLKDQPEADLTDAEKMRRARLQPGEVPIDPEQSRQLAEAELADPAVQNAEIEATNNALTADALSSEELTRAADEVTADEPDQLVREVLGEDPDAVDVRVEKAETGRGWIVIDPSGEQLGEKFATKRAAQKKANAEKTRIQDQLRANAQQRVDDATGEVMEVVAYNPARDSNITGKVKLTQPQINELIKYPNFRPIFDQFGVSKKTYSFTQGDMNDFVDGARAMIAAGVDKRRAQMLRKLIDKFDTAAKLIEDQVRPIREADSIMDQNKRFLDHGDYC